MKNIGKLFKIFSEILCISRNITLLYRQFIFFEGVLLSNICFFFSIVSTFLTHTVHCNSRHSSCTLVVHNQIWILVWSGMVWNVIVHNNWCRLYFTSQSWINWNPLQQAICILLIFFIGKLYLVKLDIDVYSTQIWNTFYTHLTIYRENW